MARSLLVGGESAPYRAGRYHHMEGTVKIQDAMTPDPFCCSKSDSLNEAARIMWDHDCGFIPVIDDDRRVVGALTDRDAFMAAYTQGKPLTELPVEAAMTRRVISVHPDESIERAESLMREHQIRRLAVTDQDGRLRGVLSLNDLATTKGIADKDVSRTLAAICAPRHHAAAAE